ncbi:hypothetical protein DBR22_14340 [Arthrobacter sp. HMWF013]|nr:hypothetical protein DBR22_14340 [Arthrobacter sp. HMWF013]
MGLALFSVAVPASADNENKEEKLVSICHGGNMTSMAPQGVGGPNGHSGHPDDIIEPYDLLPLGLNWNEADGFKNCGVVVPPVVVVTPPPVVVTPETPVIVTPETPTIVEPPAEAVVPAGQTPAAQTPAPQAAAPKAAAPQAAAKVPAAAASAVKGTNQGYNAQTSVGGAGESTTWLAGLGVLLGAGALVALRRRSGTESPTAG